MTQEKPEPEVEKSTPGHERRAEQTTPGGFGGDDEGKEEVASDALGHDDKEQSQQGSQSALDRWGKSTARATWWIVIVTLLNGGAIAYQSRVTNHALAAAQKSNRLAKLALKRNRDIAEASQRAWILLDGVTLNCGDRETGTPARLTYAIRNFGRSPASYIEQRNVRIEGAERDPTRTSSKKSEGVMGFDREPHLERAVIGPGQAITGAADLPGPLSSEKWMDRGRPKAALYLKGEVVYRDGYRKERMTKWCVYWLPEPCSEEPSTNFRQCDTHNEAS